MPPHFEQLFENDPVEAQSLLLAMQLQREEAEGRPPRPHHNHRQRNRGENSAERNLEEERALRMALEESAREVPNTENMSYEQLLELEERMGKVSKGFTKQ